MGKPFEVHETPWMTCDSTAVSHLSLCSLLFLIIELQNSWAALNTFKYKLWY